MQLHIWFVGSAEPIEVRMDTEVENVDALGILLSQARWLAVDGGRLINLSNVRMIRLLQSGEGVTSSVARMEI
ncbi:hypothetical protein [Chloracidobacterium aggregatum]|jgi:hypothetical protein|uniref:Uncharacterized protein n=1 Tax=Chloracidobacterium sp. N TaxID=2821540 RepID=A0ABX8B2N0_9BACT|nr:hypothetical protein [Chloracidobacterium aggregatum]QUV84829.1 hypothetical protein J8C03_00620 [Chloracidobacterium sp. 2]QUV88770.1 hypothetical protein J8C07_05535 [Chloracidobacterium sp. S]QUV91687.1 hypothetical protein J8C04_04665 [Chloracidobacterium sp. A]QUV94862.1 hypothetical protein J8C05_05345 [Chloracidobacterium sp. N]QUV95974.1 hypothetical protein J8C00_06445 [Chloracidobacterium sp. E]